MAHGEGQPIDYLPGIKAGPHNIADLYPILIGAQPWPVKGNPRQNGNKEAHAGKGEFINGGDMRAGKRHIQGDSHEDMDSHNEDHPADCHLTQKGRGRLKLPRLRRCLGKGIGTGIGQYFGVAKLPASLRILWGLRLVHVHTPLERPIVHRGGLAWGADALLKVTFLLRLVYATAGRYLKPPSLPRRPCFLPSLQSRRDQWPVADH